MQLERALPKRRWMWASPGYFPARTHVRAAACPAWP